MKTQAGPVSPDERKQALEHDQDRAVVERLGIPVAGKIGWDLRRKVMSTYRYERGMSAADINRVVVRPLVRQLQPLLIAGMLAAHLRGYRTAIATSRPTRRIIAFKRASEYGSVYDAAIDAMRKRIGLSIDELAVIETAYSASAIRVLGDTSDMIEKRLETAIAESAEAGLHVKDGIKALQGAFDAVGITPENSFTLENLFRTQTQLAYGAGRWQADQAPEIQEILWGYKYCTIGDDRVRPEHQGLEGTTAEKDDPIWQTIWPPCGWSCRCSTISIFEKRKIVMPPAVVEIDGKEYTPGPDKGFGYNAGMFFGPT